MSDSEDESDADFSASEGDEFVPTEDDSDEESEQSEMEEEEEEQDLKNKANKTLKVTKRVQFATTSKSNKRNNNEDDDDSDSSVENYLVDPNNIDLASDFFSSHSNTTSKIPTFDCNIGVSLSDSEEEVFEEIPSTSQKPLDFNAHANFNENLERAKEQLKNYKSTNFGQENNENDVTKLLAIGESTSSFLHQKRSIALNGSDESDWEEVEGASKVQKKDNVEVRIGPTLQKKPDKHQAEIEASIKRKINRRKKETQLAMHKVHLLSWIAYGNFVNKVLNSTKLMEMVVKFIPSEKCYPKSQTDVKFFEQIIKWYKTVIGLKSKEQNCDLKCLPPIASSLALQIQSKMAICKKDFVFIFVILLRSIGIQCRLVVNLATVPIRPPAKELCVISMKNFDQKTSTTKAKEKSKIDPKRRKVSSKTSKSARSSSKADDKLKETVRSESLDRPSTSNKVSKIGDGTSKSMNDLKSKLDAAVKNTSKNPSTEFKGKQLKRRSLSLNNNSSIDIKPKRTRISTLVDDLDDGRTFSKATSNTISVLNSPISRRTRSREPVVNSKNVNISTKGIPQLDGADDKKTNKQKPQLLKFRLPPRTSLSRSPSPPATTKVSSSKSKTQPKDASMSPTKSVSETASQPTKKISTKKELVSEPASTKEKPQLYRLRLPHRRSRSVSKSPTRSTFTSKRSSSTSTAIRTTAETKKSQPKSNSSDTSMSPTKSVTSQATKKVSTKKKMVSEPTTTKEKPQLYRLRLPQRRSRSVSKSPTQSTSTSKTSSSASTSIKTAAETTTKKSQPKSNSSDTSMSPTKSVMSQPTKKVSTKKKMVSEPTTTKEKPQLHNLRYPQRSRSVSKSPIPSTSTSRRSNSTSSVRTAETTTIKSVVPTPSTTITSTTSTSSKKIANKFSSKTKSMTSSTAKESIKNVTIKRKSVENVSSDSDFAPTPKKKGNFSADTPKPLPKAVEKLKKRIDTRILSTDDEAIAPANKKNEMNYWIEVFCEAEDKWMCIDLFKLKVNCIDDVRKNATKPIGYVFAWNNNNKIKDVSSRYCPNWNTTTRKLRVEIEWINKVLSRYMEANTARSRAEDSELNKIHLKEPLPSTISESKNHPLYALQRHLLKFEGIYPPNAIPCGYIRNEAVYSRDCVHTLHSREIWVKQARVVKPVESPYKIVKARPKWDRLANKMLEPQPLEIFGIWQTQPYEPPTAENGIVPRNAYGNVELFKPEMLPKKTVHLRLAGLNRVCSKLKVDCAQAVVGFDFHGGSSHPTFDGFVVCEEFAELVTAQWVEEQEEAERKAVEKQNQRIYGNWKKLIKGLLIRERLQRKYNFAGKETSSSSSKK